MGESQSLEARVKSLSCGGEDPVQTETHQP